MSVDNLMQVTYRAASVAYAQACCVIRPLQFVAFSSLFAFVKHLANHGSKLCGR
jgi:hypothetical protein